MPEKLLSSRRPDREHEVAQGIFELVFPGSERRVSEGKRYFAMTVEGYVYKVEVKEVGKRNGH